MRSYPKMGKEGFEPSTSRLSSAYSEPLSYMPRAPSDLNSLSDHMSTFKLEAFGLFRFCSFAGSKAFLANRSAQPVRRPKACGKTALQVAALGRNSRSAHTSGLQIERLFGEPEGPSYSRPRGEARCELREQPATQASRLLCKRKSKRTGPASLRTRAVSGNFTLHVTGNLQFEPNARRA